MQRLALLLLMGIFVCSCKNEPLVLKSSEALRINLDTLLAKDPDLDKIIAPYRDSLEKITGRIIGHSAQMLLRGKPESHLTNFVADLLLNDASHYLPQHFNHPIDFAIVNVYGLRAPIAEGSVTVGDIYKVMPFENMLSIVGLKGSSMEKLLNGFASEGGEGVAGIRFGIKGDKAVHCLIGNEQIDTAKVYYGITSDYLAKGGGGMATMKEAVFRKDLPVLLRDAIIMHIEVLTKNNQQIRVQLNGRVYVEK